MYKTATVLFDDLKTLSKTTKLQILIVVSALGMFVYSWPLMFVSHVFLIFVAYYVFKQFKYIKNVRTDFICQPIL
jgi:ABC-type bacteriocin/lantibiotic exporter with double-glycine peptidase domain